MTNFRKLRKSLTAESILNFWAKMFEKFAVYWLNYAWE